ncbi:hypothetical protein [Nocardia sp. NPDC003963]
MIQRLVGAARGVEKVIGDRELRVLGRELRRTAGLEQADIGAARSLRGIGDPDTRAYMEGQFARARADERARAGREVAVELERIRSSGVRSRWVNFVETEVPCRKFEAWIHAPTEGPLPALGPDSGMNCYEMLFYAAVQRKRMSHAQLRELYKPLRIGGTPRAHFPASPYWGKRVTAGMLPHGWRHYTPGDPDGLDLEPGLVVMWGNGSHAAVTSGGFRGVGPARSPEIYSFFPPPKDFLTRSYSEIRNPVTGTVESTGSIGTVTDAVQLTSIDELTPHLIPGEVGRHSPALPPTIRIGPGPWSL